MKPAYISGIKIENICKINELPRNIGDPYRGINYFKSGYQPRNNL
jgi:hypothetical protein